MRSAGDQGAKRAGRLRAALLGTASFIAVATAALPSAAEAADLNWDGNSGATGLGGSGTWNTTTANWSTATDGVSGLGFWTNNLTDVAIFGGTAGTVNITSGITANRLRFNVGTYTLNGGPLTLGGATPTIEAAANVWINAVIAGTAGLTKTGAGVLTLNGANTFTGGINFQQGYLDINSVAAVNGNVINMSGGRLRGSANLAGVTVNLSGTTAQVHGSAPGAAHFTGTGDLTILTDTIVYDNTNDFTGKAIFGVNGNAGFMSVRDLGQASSLGAGDGANGVIAIVADSPFADSVSYYGTGDSSNRPWEFRLNGSSSGATLQNRGSGVLTITGDISATGTASTAFGFSAVNSDMVLTGIISSSNTRGVGLSGGSSARKITLGGANTYTGQTAISAVTVVAPVLADSGVTSSLGAGSNITMSNDGVLSYTGAAASSNRTWTFGSGSVGGTGRILNDGSGALDLSGALTFVHPTVNSLTLGGSYAGVNTLSGVISGTGNLISNGAGTWVLSGANTRTGSITMTSGTLRGGSPTAFGTTTTLTVNGGLLDLAGANMNVTDLDGAGGEVALGSGTLTLDYAGASPTIYSGIISGSGGLTKLGAGTLTLRGANTYTGPTNLNAGTLRLDFANSGAVNSNIIAPTSAVSIATASTLDILGAAGEANSQTFGGLTIGVGANTVNSVAGAGGSLTVDFGAINRTAGQVNFVRAASGVTLLTSNSALGGWAMINNTDYAKVVAGEIVPFDASDYTSQDDASQWQNNQFISDAGPDSVSYFGTVGADRQLAGLQFTEADATTTITIAPTARLGVDGTIIVAPSVGANNQLITGGEMTGLSGGGALGVQHSGGGTFEIASTIVDSAPGVTNFVKGGTGIVRLSGLNTYTGSTLISQGTLEVTTLADGGSASSIGDTSNAASNLVIDAGTLSYVGPTVIIDRGFTLTRTTGTTGAVNVSTGGTNLTFTGQVTSPDGAGLTKTGPGTLTLTNAANNYAGITTIDGGVLSITTIGNGGAASTLGASSSASSNLVLKNNGELEYAGPTATTNRGLTLEVSDGAIDVASNTTILTISGAVIGAGALTKEGAGTLILSGANTYTGTTTVNAGVLRAGSSQAFGTGHMIVNSGATLQLATFSNTVGNLAGAGTIDLGSGTLTIGGPGGGPVFTGTITGTGGITRNGAFTQIINGCGNTYDGPTRILRGNLSVNCLANGGQASSIGDSGSASSNLVIGGEGQLVYTGPDVSIDRGVTLSASWGYINVDSGKTLGFSGKFTGPGILKKTGAGTLVLSNATNDYATTIVDQGTLRADASGALGSGGLLFNGAATTVDFNGNDQTLQYINSQGLAQGTLALGGANLTISNGFSLNFGGVIAGTGGLLKSGAAGLQTLSGCNSSYTGSTVVNSGTLNVFCLADGGANSSIGGSTADAGNLVINGATLAYGGAGSTTNRQFTLGAAATGSTLSASGTGPVVFSNTAAITLTGTNARIFTLDGASVANNTLSALIADAGAGATTVTKTGAGTWVLGNTGSTYTGVTTVNQGVLSVSKLANGGQASSIGRSTSVAGNLVIGGTSGGTLRYVGAGDTTDRAFSLNQGSAVIESSGTGAIQFLSTAAVTLPTLNVGRVIGLGGTNTGDNILGGSLANAGTGVTTLAKNDAGKWILTGANTYGGDTTISGGILQIGNGGTNGSITSPRVVMSAGTLAFNRSDDLTYAGVVSGVGSLQQLGAGRTTLSGTNTYSGGTTISAGTLELGAGGATGSIAGNVTNNGRLTFNRSNAYAFTGLISGSGELRQVGSGTTVLSANNSYLGPTNVEAGVLRINGDQSGSTGLTTVFTGGTLGGGGTIGGDVLVQNGGVLSPGNSPGELTINGDLTLNASSVLDMEFGQANAVGGPLNDLITVNGDLTLDGVLNVSVPTGGVFSAGVYRVINYTGALTDNGLTLGTMPGGSSAAVQTAVAGQVNLVNSAGQSLFFWDGPGGGKNDGAITGGAGTWRLGGGANDWTSSTGTPNSDFAADAFAVFQGTAGAITVDDVGGAVGVSGIQFAVNGYTVGGDGLTLAAPQTAIRVGDGTGASAGMTASISSVLSGLGQLVKVDDGTLVLSGVNTYTGGTLINGGLLSISSDANLGAASGGLILDGGALRNTAQFNSARSVTLASGGGTIQTDTILTLSGAITGTGTLTKTGASTLTLLGDKTYSGGTTISAGELRIGDAGIAGSIIGDVVNNGTISFRSPGLQTFAGVISGSGNVGKASAGTVVFSGDNTYAGLTSVLGGTLLINGDQSGATGLTSVAGSATLGGSGVIGGNVSVGGTGTLAPGGETNAPGQLTINGNLTVGSSASLNYDFGQAGVPGGALNDLAVVGGNLTLDGTINVAATGGAAMDPGLYRVIDYAGALTNNGLNVGATPVGTSFAVQTSVAGQVNLVNSAGVTVNFWDGAAGVVNDSIVTGGAGLWDASDDNWTTETGAFNTAWPNGNFAIFAGVGGAVTVDGAATPSVSGMQFAVDGYSLSGGALTLAGADAVIRVGDGTAAGAGMTATIGSALGGSAKLVKVDLGTLVLSGANTYAGGADVNAGTLFINGDQSGATGATTVNTGATLAGLGRLGGDVAVGAGATLAPGAGGAGTLTIAGDLTLDAGATLNMDLGQAGTAGGGLNDLIVVGGDLGLDGTLNVSTTPGGVFGPGIYRLINYTGTLTDGGLSIGSVPSGAAVVQTSIANQVNLVVDGGGGGGGGGGPGPGPGPGPDPGPGPGPDPGPGPGPGPGPDPGPDPTYNFWDGAAGPGDDRWIQGGDGVWQAGAGNHSWTSADGARNGGYADGGFAIFAGAGGAVTVDASQGAISASGMQFAADGYRLAGDPVRLGGPEAIVRVGDGSTVGAGFTATIASQLTGATRLNKTDGGTLVLSGDNTYTGGTLISGGTLQLGDGGTSGSIAGDVTNQGALAFDRSDDLSFAGVISGAGVVRQIGEGTVRLAAVNTYTGGTVIESGTLRGSAASFGTGAIEAAGGLVIDQGADASFANAINGLGTFTKLGAGRLTYTGSGALTGPTAVEAGVLVVNGSLASSPVRVRTGAGLAGRGAVGAASVETGASVAPGDSGVGQLTVNGAFRQAGGSTYQVEIDPAGDASDRILISGAATLDQGAVLKVTPTSSGLYRLGAIYNVLSAAGGVSGTYTLDGGGVLSAFLSLEARYDATNVNLSVEQVRALTEAALTPNQTAAAGGADGLPAGSGLRTALVNLPDDAAARTAFDRISGEALASAKGVLVTQSAMVREAALTRMRDVVCDGEASGRRDPLCHGGPDRATGWAQALGGWGHIDGDGNAAKTKHSAEGFMTGLDAPLGGWRLGGFVAYTHSNWDVDARSSSGSSQDYHLGAYGGRAFGKLSLRLGASQTWHDADATRSAAFRGFTDTMSAGYDARTTQAFGDVAYSLRASGVELAPFVNVAHVRLRTDGFAESGGEAALTHGGDTLQTTLTTVGLRPSTQVDLGSAKATLRGLIGWRHAFGDVAPTAGLNFDGSNAFEVRGAPLGRDALAVEAGLDVAVGDGGMASFTYGGQYSERAADHRLRLDLRLRF